jgi:CheY-like chemotaxis protein
MKLLLVEDDDNKRQQVLELLCETFPKLGIEVAISLISALRALKNTKPDIVLLDMTLPNYDVADGAGAGGLHAFGGEEFLRQARRFGLKPTVVVITQFETFGDPPNDKGLAQLDAELQATFPDLYKGAVYYHASIYDWTAQLIEKLTDAVPEIEKCR